MRIVCITCNEVFESPFRQNVKDFVLDHVRNKHREEQSLSNGDILFLYTVQLHCQGCQFSLDITRGHAATIEIYLDHYCEAHENEEIQREEEQRDREEREDVSRNFCGYGTFI